MDFLEVDLPALVGHCGIMSCEILGNLVMKIGKSGVKVQRGMADKE